MSGARVVDGTGVANVATGVPVLDHLLTELARAARFDLTLEIEPDDPEAEVDAAGTALGRAIGPRLADGAHGEATAPADEALATVVVERSGRPLVASNADLTGAGGLGTDLAARFLDRLADGGGPHRARAVDRGRGHRSCSRGDLQGARHRARARFRPLTRQGGAPWRSP